jgi:methylase of polypeptide subunit release factors
MMRAVTVADTPLADDLAAELGRLRVALLEAGFTERAVLERLGVGGHDARGDDLALVERKAGADVLGSLMRLLLLELPVEKDELRRSGAAAIVDDLLVVGLVVEQEGKLGAHGRVIPHGELLLASDRVRTPGGLRADHVSGFTPAARLCANLTVRRPVAATLDLGTGCGTHALLAASHSERVVATDVNPRALAFTAFNLALNGIDNVELRAGSLFEPVAGEHFDLIVANAPYVISGETTYVFRDGGMRGDGFSAQLVAEAPAHLAEEGLALLMVSWLRATGASGFERPRRWIEGNGCDAWLIAGRALDPLEHASVWTDSVDPEQYGGKLDSWVAHLRELGADRIVEGAAILRRRGGGRNWVRVDTAPGGEFGPAGEHVQRVFASNDRLVELGDDALLDSVVVLTDAHRFETSFAARDGVRTEVSTVVRLADGLLFSAQVDGDLAELLVRLDGRVTVREALREAARAAGVDESGVEEFAGPTAAIVRELLGRGVLVFAEDRAA